MRRTALLALPLLLVVVTLGQIDPREQLQQLLLTQEELQGVLGEGWVTETIDRLNPEPEGAITVVANYKNKTTEIPLFIGLLNFQEPDFLERFVKALLEARPVVSSQDLLAQAKEGKLELPESLQPKQENIEKLLLLVLVDGQQQIVMQRHSLLEFARSPLEPGQLIQVTDRQLRKILEFCAGLESETRPKYC